MYDGYEVLSAPNRFRKLFNPLMPEDVVASSGMRMLALEGVRGFNEAREKALTMQKAEWPDKADRAIGYEPHFSLCDEVLIWRAT